mmetsp:Transcript_49307/g.138123  ORF Transcript_49307/g.138123 Transcript_49307/m.138123 type:complete len:98 (-) Transcript_49307:144-437(-)
MVGGRKQDASDSRPFEDVKAGAKADIAAFCLMGGVQYSYGKHGVEHQRGPGCKADAATGALWFNAPLMHTTCVIQANDAELRDREAQAEATSQGSWS